jgi:hypothetical protein
MSISGSFLPEASTGGWGLPPRKEVPSTWEGNILNNASEGLLNPQAKACGYIF